MVNYLLAYVVIDVVYKLLKSPSLIITVLLSRSMHNAICTITLVLLQYVCSFAMPNLQQHTLL